MTRIQKSANIAIFSLAFAAGLVCIESRLWASSNPSPNPKPTRPLNLTGASGTVAEVESIGSGVVRIWYKPSLGHTRAQSNALLSDLPQSEKLTVANSPNAIEASTSELHVSVDPKTLDFDATSPETGTLFDDARFNWTKTGGWTLSYKLRPDEHLLGLGEDNRNGGCLNRRGTIRDLWTGQQINSGNVTANDPIPLLISVDAHGHAYGIFIDDAYRMQFDLGATNKDTLVCNASGGEPDFYIINGPSIKQVIENYTALTGRSPMPPLWTLGYWQSKCWFWNWNDVDGAYNGLKQRGYPVDALVIDASWPQKWNDFVWDPRWYTNGLTPYQRIKAYTKKGVKIFMSNSGPMVVKDSPTFPSGWKAGVFATDGQGNPVEAGYYHGELLDFTSPNMTSWLLPQITPLMEAGMAGWWLDLSEPEGDSPTTTYHGGDFASIHNQYSLLETRWFENAQLTVKPNQRPWVLTRCGSAGIQKYHMSVWSGDTHSDYATLGAHPPEMLNAGLSGLTYWTCDSGGFLTALYKSDQYGAHAKLYDRWMQFSVFSPLTRAHHAGPALPFEFGSATEQNCLHYIKLRYQLLPYIYSYSYEASKTGLPIVRPLVMDYPTDTGSLNAAGDEYLFGDELIVAPVLTEDTTKRSVYFPPGKWYDWDTGHEYVGGKSITVDAPQYRIPVAVRSGSIIPLAPLMANTSEKPWDPITVLVYPSGKSSFSMYTDDGETFDYLKGKSTATEFTSDDSNRLEKFTISASNTLFQPHMYLIKFHLQQVPGSILVDGKSAKSVPSGEKLLGGQYTWDPANGVLTVAERPGKSTSHGIEIKLTSRAISTMAPAMTN